MEINVKCINLSHISDLKVLSHEEVERCAGVGSDGADAAATVSEETQTQIGTLFRLFLKQQLWKLNTHTQPQKQEITI